MIMIAISHIDITSCAYIIIAIYINDILEQINYYSHHDVLSLQNNFYAMS